jgi:hypothetical protein
MIRWIESTAHGRRSDSTRKAWYSRQARLLNYSWVALAGLILFLALSPHLLSAQDTTQNAFPVKFVSADAVYLEGGSNSHLAQGQKLTIKKKGAESGVIAQIQIESVASASAVGKILSGAQNIAPGDVAYLSPEDVNKLNSETAVKYPQIITFTQDNPLEEEVRENLPKPNLPEINRIRGRVGSDFGYLQQPGGTSSSLYGMTLRIDATRLGGSHWNLSGYYRGYRRSNGGSSATPTLVELVNRTYHLSLNYDNPNSRWVAGAGRLFIPWASSLDTIDGFYLGRRFGKATAGVFGGSAPDPTSWDYDPHRQMAGGFVNFEGGSFESWRYTSTAGVALTRVNWHPDRQFGFFQNGIFYKNYFSLYSDVQCDLSRSPSDSLAVSASSDSGTNLAQRGLALSRSYLTLRIQPLRALSFDISENYFRSIPTFDERLLSTGLLDKYLFQGLSGGVRIELPHKFGIYTTLGRSNRSGDTRPSWDYLVGLTASDILHTGIRADLRYSRFDSSFGRGTYQSVLLARDLGKSVQFDVQVGRQNTVSALTNQDHSRFINGNLNWLVGTQYYLGVGIAAYSGGTQNYRQLYATIGYRFDNRRRKRE